MSKFLSRQSRLLLSLGVIFSLAACNSAPSTSSEPVQYNMISLSESAMRSVAKDEMTVNLMVMEEGKTPADLTRKVTEKINQLVKLSPEAEASQTTITLTGRYSERVRKGLWREVAYVRVVGTDFPKINQIIEQTQEYTRIQNISFEISAQTKAKTENELTEEALTRLQERSKLVAKTMGLSNFRIVNMNIGTQTTRSPDDPYPMYAMEAAPNAAADMAVATDAVEETPEPTIAAEKQNLNLSVNAQIQLY